MKALLQVGKEWTLLEVALLALALEQRSQEKGMQQQDGGKAIVTPRGGGGAGGGGGGGGVEEGSRRSYPANTLGRGVLCSGWRSEHVAAFHMQANTQVGP
jgi:hypothetical protein